MNLLALLDRCRRLPLDARYAALLEGKKHFKPHSGDMEHLVSEIKRVYEKRLRRDLNKRAA